MCHCFTFLLMDRAEDGRLDDDTEECQSLFVYTAAHHHSGRSIMRKRRTDRDSPGVSRRHFVSSTAAAAFAGAFGPRLFAAATAPEVPSDSILGGRAAEAYSVRVAAADLARKLPCEGHRGNGDETCYATKWASYTKALPHDALGHVVPDAYAAYLAAMSSGNAEEMEKIPLGGF